jgi:hypothetical protein
MQDGKTAAYRNELAGSFDAALSRGIIAAKELYADANAFARFERINGFERFVRIGDPRHHLLAVCPDPGQTLQGLAGIFSRLGIIQINESADLFQRHPQTSAA